ncbi:LIC_10190 family membrane protein [Dokdonia ponticola]|uniref:LIC_10190 family membrane protein n=1 Tax=Dokdonia ponticola TaxID=2041041 RepID=A0ABV9HW30_9FLAO
MLAVLTYWCYLFFVTSVVGVGFQHFCKLGKSHPVIPFFLGGFAISIFASIWAIFSGLGNVFESFLVLITLGLGIWKRKVYHAFLLSLKAKIKTLPSYLIILFVVITLFAIAQCASAPYIIDNESYYIQTIKWLDTFGFVKGLANFHFFLAQNSGWHILQSAVNLDGVLQFLNDINGFYLILGNFYALDYLGRFFKHKEKQFLLIGLFPIFNVFLFQFISSPSPDLPIYLLSLLIFGEFLKHYTSSETSTISLLFALGVFAIFIKVTAVFLILFPVILYAKNRKLLKQDFLKLILISGITFILFVIKNSIISGYPLYPIASFRLTNVDWILPIALQEYLVETTKHYAFFLTPEEYQNTTFMQRVIHWLRLPKLHGLFNVSMCIALVIFPFLIRKIRFKKPLYILYFISSAQLLFLWLTSPQYRFFLGFFMLLVLTIITVCITKKILVKIGITIATVAIAIPLFIPFNLNALTENEFQLRLSVFSMDYLIKPHPNTKYTQAIYTTHQEGNLKLQTPTNIDFFWATGDCELPCIQLQHLTDFKAYFRSTPQMRTNDLKDGFYSYTFDDE